MKILIVVLTFICSISLPILAQTPDFQTVRTEKGMMVLNNNKTQPFSFLVAGTNPKGEQDADGSLTIQTDSNGVLIYFTKVENFLDKDKKLTENEILKTHRNFEILNMENSVQRKINVDKEGLDSFKVHDLRKGKDEFASLQSVYWSYPATNPAIPNRLYFQNVLLGDEVLMIGMVFNKSANTEKIQGMLKEIFESITLMPSQKQVTAPKNKAAKSKVRKN